MQCPALAGQTEQPWQQQSGQELALNLTQIFKLLPQLKLGIIGENSLLPGPAKPVRQTATVSDTSHCDQCQRDLSLIELHGLGPQDSDISDYALAGLA